MFNLQPPVVLIIGNKVDMEAKRKVTTVRGQTLAQQLNCGFFEGNNYSFFLSFQLDCNHFIIASAKNNTNITELFHELVRRMRKRKEAAPKPPSPRRQDQPMTAQQKQQQQKEDWHAKKDSPCTLQ